MTKHDGKDRIYGFRLWERVCEDSSHNRVAMVIYDAASPKKQQVGDILTSDNITGLVDALLETKIRLDFGDVIETISQANTLYVRGRQLSHFPVDAPLSAQRILKFRRKYHERFVP
ncbi:MAG: hypothetical protein KJ718_05745 [Nanoarchaeota archaeon]|nr:hypothetical protein [Nanoarchaeota archaeon]MBU1052026.1 hypothetical protein [Nanoarchaeota archaeon]MBU1987887.1 hypothetical protein [Nanoarchaeota archaeon]